MSKDLEIIRQLAKQTGYKLEQVDEEGFQWTSRCFVVNEEGRITYLKLYDMGLEDLSPLASLSALTQLDLTNNKIQDLSPLASLSALTQLDLRSNKIQDLSPLASLSALTTLWLQGNEVQDLSPLGSLSALTTLWLQGNEIQDLSPLGSLSALTTLDLRSNQIEDLTPCIALSELAKLYVEGNKIKTVPLVLCQRFSEISLEGSQGLSLDDNPLERPPLEIVDRGRDAVLAWFEAQEEEPSRLLNQVKVLLVGDGAAGKTSLVKRITHDDFDPQEPQTHGIHVADWQAPGPCDEPMTVKFWDFGGQEIMHATHQFFLTRRSLYIVVQSARKQNRLSYWLQHIRSFGGNAPVLVVINKIDQNPGFDLNERQLLREFSNIVGFHSLSCATGEGLPFLIGHLRAVLPDLELVSASWPGRWFKVKEELEALDEPFITFERYREMCGRHALSEEQEKALLNYLHDLGVMLYFPDFHLRHTQVLKPDWATKGVYRLINAPQLAASKGLLDFAMLEEMLRPEPGEMDYPAQTHIFLVELMRKFELCYRMPDQEAVLIPDLLSENEPENLPDGPEALNFLVRYNFLPPSVMPRLIVRLHRDIEKMWRSGMVLRQGSSQAVVIANPVQQQIEIRVLGKDRRHYFITVLYFLRDINSGFEKLEVDEMVPLPDDPQPRYALTYTMLLEAERDGDKHVRAQNGKRYELAPLLGQVREEPTDEATDLARMDDNIASIRKHLEEPPDKLAVANKIIDFKLNIFGFSIAVDEALLRLKKWWASRKDKPKDPPE